MENELEVRPYKLKNEIQNYPWGSKGEKAFIPQLLGIETEPDRAYAELWIGSYPKAPSKVVINSEQIDMDKLIKTFPKNILGADIATKYQNNLPFLLKVLSADEPLSIQTHPNKGTAEKLNKNYPEHYPDANHKPEIAIALDSLEALVGFRPISEIITMLESYKELVNFIGNDKVSKLRKIMKNSKEPQEILENVFSSMINKAVNNPKELKKLCQKLSQKFQKNLKFNRTQDKKREKLFLQLKEKYDYEVGLLVIFFLNFIHLEKNEAVFLDTGILHTYLKGNIVECMANSDNVIRAGLTNKHKDIETLTQTIEYTPRKVDILNSNQEAKTKVEYPNPASEFNIYKYDLDNCNTTTIENIHSVEVLFIVEGSLIISKDDNKLQLNKGESALIPAEMEKYKIIPSQKTAFFRVYVPGE